MRSAVKQRSRVVRGDLGRRAPCAARYVSVTFLSSSGLRALLLVRKELLAQNVSAAMCAQPQVREVFTLTGLRSFRDPFDA